MIAPSKFIDMAHIAVQDIKQNDIADAAADKLCLALCDIQIAGSLLLLQGKRKTPFTLEDVDAIIDAAIANGGIASKDGVNSDNGWVASHEKVAEAAGLSGYTKKYTPFNAAILFALLQWGSLVELRDEGKHSLLATSWFKANDGVYYCTVSDPWRATNDIFIDSARALTYRADKTGTLVPSRSIEYLGYYVRRGTNWL